MAKKKKKAKKKRKQHPILESIFVGTVSSVLASLIEQLINWILNR